MPGAIFVLTGQKELDRKLSEMSRSVVRKVAAPAVQRALTIMKKSIQSEIPPKYKSAKRSIGKRFNKAKTGGNKGMVVAKVGAGVAAKTKAKAVDRKGKRGVGLSPRNIHWAILGTQRRQSKKTNADRGKMPATLADVVKSGIAKSEGQAMSQMVQTIRARIKEFAK